MLDAAAICPTGSCPPPSNSSSGGGLAVGNIVFLMNLTRSPSMIRDKKLKIAMERVAMLLGIPTC